MLVGDVSTGKTHMASALCMLACERRMEARFFTASSLVMRLRRARDEGRLDREAALIGCARLLVIDELGFLPLDPDGARALLGVRRRLRAAVGGHHHEPGVQPVGRGVRRRPDGGGGDRQARPPRQARPVPRGVLPGAQRAHAGGLGAQKRRARTVRKLLNSR